MLGCWVSWEVQSLNNESHVTKRTTDTAWLHYTTWTMISAVESIINITRFHQRKCCTLLYTWYSYTTCRADWTITFFHHLCFRWTKHRAEASVSPPPLHCPEHALQKLATWKKKKTNSAWVVAQTISGPIDLGSTMLWWEFTNIIIYSWHCHTLLR